MFEGLAKMTDHISIDYIIIRHISVNVSRREFRFSSFFHTNKYVRTKLLTRVANCVVPHSENYNYWQLFGNIIEGMGTNY